MKKEIKHAAIFAATLSLRMLLALISVIDPFAVSIPPKQDSRLEEKQ
jgi:hypothetical protein